MQSACSQAQFAVFQATAYQSSQLRRRWFFFSLLLPLAVASGFEEGMLTRDFISASLYAQDSGYFNNDARVFGVVAPQALPFTELANKYEYRKRLTELYQSTESCWLTPVELYKPFYAQAIARWILDMRVRDQGQYSVPRKERAEEDGCVPVLSEEELRALTLEEAEESARNAAGVSDNPHAYRAAAAATATGADSSAAASGKPSRAGIPAPLRIVEMGGGNGTCALNILDYLAKHYPSLYEQTEYTIVELSEVLSRKQRVVLRKHLRHHLAQADTPQAQGNKHSSRAAHSQAGSIASKPRVRLLHMSMVEWRELIADQTVFVLGLEVLDNMPHDRVRQVDEQVFRETRVHSRARAQASQASDPSLAQALRDAPEPFPYLEVLQPISDPLVAEYHSYTPFLPTKPFFSVFRPELWYTYSDAWRAVGFGLVEWRHANKYFDAPSYWYPTTQLQLLHVLRRHLPQHHLLLADFHFLPSTVEGRNGPVVAAKGRETGGKTQDHSSHLIAQGGADIFFPTDFAALHYVYQRVCMGRDHEQVAFAGNGIQPPPREVATDALQGYSRQELAGGGHRNTPRVMTNYEFMSKYAKGYEQFTTTKNGWCALQRDYLNMSFFLS